MRRISFGKIFKMSLTCAPFTLRMAISLRRRFTSSLEYPNEADEGNDEGDDAAYHHSIAEFEGIPVGIDHIRAVGTKGEVFVGEQSLYGVLCFGHGLFIQLVEADKDVVKEVPWYRTEKKDAHRWSSDFGCARFHILRNGEYSMVYFSCDL